MLFELLFLIYLLPVVVLFILLLRFARFIIVNVFRAAIWIIKKNGCPFVEGTGLVYCTDSWQHCSQPQSNR